MKDFSFAIKDNCQKFQWSILNSGQCGVFYEIQILDSKKRILSRSTTQPFANFLSFCYAKYTHNNVSAGIRAIYDNKYGNWSSVKPMKGYPETESSKFMKKTSVKKMTVFTSAPRVLHNILFR